MAVDSAPRLMRRRNFAFKAETTTGTAESLAAADGVVPVFDPTFKIDIEKVDRPGLGSLSPWRQGLGARSATIEFTTELYGVGSSGSGVPAWTSLLLGCGMQEGTGAVYSPLTGATTTLTMGAFLDGRTKTAAGCMGSWVLTAERGKAALMKWSFKGVPQQPDSTTITAPTYDNIIAPRSAATFTIGGTNYIVPKVEIDWGAQVNLRESLTAVDGDSDPTGYRAAAITEEFATMIKISPESLPLSTKDWYDVMRSSTTVALSLAIGSETGNTFTFAAPALQLVTAPDEEDRNGMMADTLEFLATRSADAGDDHLTLTFG